MRAEYLGRSDFRWCLVCAHKEGRLNESVMIMMMGNMQTMQTVEHPYCVAHGQWLTECFDRGELGFKDKDGGSKTLHADEVLVKWGKDHSYFL